MSQAFAFLSRFIVLATSFTALVNAGVDWQPQDGHRRAALAVPTMGKAGFTEIAATTTGITFTNRLREERSLTNQIFLNGSGVAAGDIDGDGLCDLYFCGLDSPNALYRNLGNWRFEEITSSAGVACADQASTGAAFADIDGDGDLDLLVNGIRAGTRLFLNNGRGVFREVTDEAGLRTSRGSASMALADIDGDGLLDLYIVNYRSDTMRDMPGIQFSVGVTNGVYQLLSVNGRPASAPDLAGRFTFDRFGGVLENGEPDALFRNLGQGHFVALNWTNGNFLNERGQAIQTPYDWGLSAMFRDLNGDGAPDLYVCNDFQSPDRIWINDGRGRFRAIERDSIRQTSLFSMGVDFADIDRDGHDDIFVADMFSRAHIRRQVQVMDAMAFAQVRNSADDRPQFSRNMVFRNRGNGTYAEIAQLAGLEASDWSWCPVFLDVDLDGYEDLLVTTGHWRDAQHADVARELDELNRQKPRPALEQLRLRRRFPRLDTPNVAFRNRGDLTFEETGAAWGFNSRRISQGMALADLDNDGDLDVVINCLNDGPLLCRNDSVQPRVAIRLRGLAPNTRGVGAKVHVFAPGLPPQSQEFICGGRYLSSDDFIRTFAAGNATNLLTIEVVWRSGQRSLLTNAPANHLYELDEAGAREVSSATDHGPRTTDHQEVQSSKLKVQNGQLAGASGQSSVAKKEQSAPPLTDHASRLTPHVSSFSLPFFDDVSDLLEHQHVDEPFDDFVRQPLLPHKLSQLGPGVTWFDFNDDGWDDLFISGGRGGRLAVFRNDQGRFVRQKAKVFETALDRDWTTVLGWRPNATNAALLIGLANYESGATNDPAVREFSLNNGTIKDDLLRSLSSTGPMALADVDGDGDLDLFVGGRVIAGRYPEPASSALLKNERGQLRIDAKLTSAFAHVGLVSSAIFTDINADGWPDLVLACEWGPLRVFRNVAGTFSEWNPPLRWPDSPSLNARCSTLDSLTGWWNSIAAGDFDNDGQLDLVAGNWGRNTSRQHFEDIQLYFGDADGSGNLALLEAHYDADMAKVVPARDWSALAKTFPVLQERFSNFTTFSTASLSDVLGAGLPPMRKVSAATLDSVLLLNRGDHFEARPLPMEAQVSPVFGIAVGDLDGDGNEDLFLAQNFFAVAPSESRLDAGCGAWLRGDGRGGFTSVAPSESGFTIFGEGRGVALCDFNHDGRLDLVVGQNGGATKLYRNIRARRALRVHLTGKEENPQAVGATVRLKFQSGKIGPVHEVRLGGGYWSQDSPDVLLGMPEEPSALEIRWPDGFAERVPVSSRDQSISRSR